MKRIGRRGVVGLVTAVLWLGAAPAARAVDEAHDWSKRLGDTSDNYAFSVASDPSGGVLLAGYTWSSSINLGGGLLFSQGSSDIVLAKYSSAGEHLWSKLLGGTSKDFAYSVASDPAGGVLLAWYTWSSSINLGGGLLFSQGSSDIVLAKYSSAGEHLWAKLLGGTSKDFAYSVASDPAGGVLLAGHTSSPSIDLGGGALFSQGSYDIVLAKYSSA
ncbi:MAG: SBBP repeat-containing protein, partial [Acidobacteria bacterium]|nr:SBBP repeat-containing protein [Acidobacteriota bacterium]